MLPLWSTSILLSTPIAIQLSLIVLQALTIDRHLGPRFQIPAGSMLVFSLISTAISLPIYDRIMWLLWNKIAGKHPTTLQQIEIGDILNIASMVVSAVIESKRRATATSGSNHKNMSVLWLVPQLAIVGIGEAFHFVGQVALYYQEFLSRLRSMATAMIAMLIGTGFFFSTEVVDSVRRVTKWLPDNIDDGRLDSVCIGVLAVLGIINFGYYLICSLLYEYKMAQVLKGMNELKPSISLL